MKIIVAGNGKVGFAVTNRLSREKHELVVIDSSSGALSKSLNISNVITVGGNCASMETLRTAHVEKAELLIAATNADEVNLLCCLTAKRLNRKLHTIARVRAPEYMDQIFKMREDFGLSLVINPERSAAAEIFELLQLPGSLKRESFVKGRVEIVEIKVGGDSLLKDQQLSRLPRLLGMRVLVCAVVREDEVFIPNGSVVLQEGDHIYVTAPTNILSRLMKKLGIITKKIRQATIIGAGRVSYYLAESLLNAGVEVKIIEKDEAQCRHFAGMLPKTAVICADASLQEVFEVEGIDKSDALVTLTGLDELNVIMSMYGRKLKVPLVVTKVDRLESMGILKNMEIGSTVSPKDLSSSQIVQYVRAMEHSSGAAVTMHLIANGRVETLEFKVDGNTLYTGTPLRDIPLKSGILVACIVHGDHTEIPNGDSIFKEGDSIIIVTDRKSPVLSLNEIFK